MLELLFLTFLPLDRLLIHGQDDVQCAKPLILNIRSDKIIQNPAAATALNDGTNRSMVSEGDHRAAELRQLVFNMRFLK